MDNLIFIWTLHAWLTDHEELKKIILDIKPKCLLIEMTNKDIKEDNILWYPEEMIFALNLAKEYKIPCKGFDYQLNTLQPNITKNHEQKILDEQKKIIHNKSWKDFNNYDLTKKLWDILINIVDEEKWDERENKMKSNIKKIASHEGITLILTGVWHINFFQKQFPKAKFPLIKT